MVLWVSVKSLVFIFLVCTMLESTSLSTENREETKYGSTSGIIQQWKKIEKSLQDWVYKWVTLYQPFVQIVLQEENVTTQCTDDVHLLLQDLRKLKTWAFEMLDSAGKPPGGLLEGTVTAFGSFDQCINIKKEKDDSHLLRGQYCSVHFQPPLPPRNRYASVVKPLAIFRNISSKDKILYNLGQHAQYYNYMAYRIGVCLPSTCTKNDTTKLVKRIGKYLDLNAEIISCETKEPWTMDWVQILICTTFIFVGLLVVLGTTTDMMLRAKSSDNISKTKSSLANILVAFSAYTNCQKLMDTDISTEHLRAIHGIRFLTLSWILLGHTYQPNNSKQIFRYSYMLDNIARSRGGQLLMNASVSVDVFFCISGLLTSYLVMKLLKNSGYKLDIPLFIFHRYMRLTPPMVLLIGLVHLTPLLGSGPIWHEIIDHKVTGCRKHWWINLLYLQNYIHAEPKCVEHTWYIGNDMTFHLVSLIVLIPLLKNATQGLIINCVLILGSIVFTGVITALYNYPATLFFPIPDREAELEFENAVYFSPLNHLASYCIGITVGYLIYTRQAKPLNKTKIIIGWVLSLTFLCSVLCGLHDHLAGYSELSPLKTVLYAALHRPIWTVGIAWVMFVCSTGNGGVVNTFLSWKGFIPLSRMTYMTYLTHLWILWLYIGNLRERLYSGHLITTYTFTGNMVMSFTFSFICILFVEAPFMNLEKMITSYLGNCWTEDNEMKKTTKRLNNFEESRQKS